MLVLGGWVEGGGFVLPVVGDHDGGVEVRLLPQQVVEDEVCGGSGVAVAVDGGRRGGAGVDQNATQENSRNHHAYDRCSE
ncbi:hypothetical protein Tco_1236728 [Tanacetum coccineum]